MSTELHEFSESNPQLSELSLGIEQIKLRKLSVQSDPRHIM